MGAKEIVFQAWAHKACNGCYLGLAGIFQSGISQIRICNYIGFLQIRSHTYVMLRLTPYYDYIYVFSITV